MGNLELVNEVASILRAEHPGWKGDRIENAEFFLWQLKADFPEDAAVLAEDIRQNAEDYSLLTGLPPDRIHWVAQRLTR